MSSSRKLEVITFKVDRELNQAMEGIPNRSEFIRSAILAALDSTCPLCRGTGILTSNQRKHWEEFSENHKVEKCGECDSFHIVCHARSE